VTQHLPQYIRPLLDGSLLHLSCNPNACDDSGLSALHLAAREGELKAIELILDYGTGTEIDRPDHAGMTALHLACIGGHLSVVQLLLRSGASADVTDQDCNTALHYAVMNKQLEVLKWLMGRTVRLDVRNRQGRTASELATDPRMISIFARRRPRTTLKSSHDVMIYSSTPEQFTGMLSASIPEIRDERISPSHFELMYELGRGSFGEVYLVRKRDRGDLYAMKVLRKDKIMKQNLVKYAMAERNVLSYIRHPFIVGLNFAFQTADKLFLILDYCPGGDLSSHLARTKRFGEGLARIYVCEILLALEELHSRDIIFRDLKPDNVVLDSDGHAMLTDFGLSKEGVLDNYAALSFCGSVAYLAPEVLRRQGHGKAVDWYLLGVLFYEMLVGRPPYFSHNKEELFHNIQCGKLKIPSNLSSQAKSLLLGVRHRQLLQRDPKKRLGSSRDAEEIKLHEFFEGVSWDAVMNRALRPPLPQAPAFKSETPDPAKVYGSLEESKDSRTHLSGWSFANELGK
jgi:protein-serine/threonine kinase